MHQNVESILNKCSKLRLEVMFYHNNEGSCHKKIGKKKHKKIDEIRTGRLTTLATPGPKFRDDQFALNRFASL